MDKKALAEIHLRKAIEDIARCEMFIKQQEERINLLKERDQDLTEAVNFLTFLNQVLKAMNDHREQILRELNM